MALDTARAEHAKKLMKMASERENSSIDTRFEETYAYALKALARKMYTVYELTKKLYDKEIGDPSTRGAVLRRLQELRLISDEDYAVTWIRSRTAVNPKGAHVLKQELQRKRIAPDIIDRALSSANLDEYALARLIAEKKLRTMHAQPPEKQRVRIMSLLQRRGFSYGIAKRVWSDLEHRVGSD